MHPSRRRRHGVVFQHGPRQRRCLQCNNQIIAEPIFLSRTRWWTLRINVIPPPQKCHDSVNDASWRRLAPCLVAKRQEDRQAGYYWPKQIVPSRSLPSRTGARIQQSRRRTGEASPTPCNLLTILAGNPNADITQLPPATSGEAEREETNGVDRSRPREMLIRYATSEQKLDDISRALEQGCVKSRSRAGCHVKNDVISNTLGPFFE